MNASCVLQVVLGLLLLGCASVVPAQLNPTTPCPGCGAWADVPPRALPVPLFPTTNEATWIAVFDPRRQAARPFVIVQRESPGSSPVPSNVHIETASPDFLQVTLYRPNLEPGWYVIDYFDQDSVPAEGDLPKVRTRFIVSDKGPATVVEYFNVTLGHYFMTGNPVEIAKLDGGEIHGWRRTGETFHAWPPEEIPSFAQPVCRFYGLPSAGLDTHFYSAIPEECAEVLVRWPDKWIRESDFAFGAMAPAFPFDCGQPLFRLYNNRPDANHRYTVSTTVRDQMAAQGWTVEGTQFDGPYTDPYTMCVLP